MLLDENRRTAFLLLSFSRKHTPSAGACRHPSREGISDQKPKSGVSTLFSEDGFLFFSFLPDPRPQTRSSPSTNHYSLITNHRS